MKASKVPEAQKAFIVKQGEQGTPVSEICREAGTSQAGYFNWKKYGDLLLDWRTAITRQNHAGIPWQSDCPWISA